MRDYKPSNLLAPQGILFLLVAVIVGGVAIGLITYFVSTLIYLIILFPLVIGAVAGGVIAGAVIIGKVRSPMGAAIFGLLIAVVLYGTYRYAEYEIGFEDDMHDAYIDDLRNRVPAGASMSDEQLEEQLDTLLEALGAESAADFELKEATGSTGFGAFIEYSADLGVTFNRASSSSDSGLNISGTGAYIYWAIELLVIAGIAAAIGYGRASAPFSEETKEWFGKDEYVATIPPDAVAQYYQLLKDGNYQAAGQMMVAASNAPPPRVDVMVKRVASPTADLVLVIKKLTPKKNRVDTDDLHTGLLSPSEFSQLQSSMAARPTPSE